MSDQSNHSKEQLHQLFFNYLIKKFEGENDEVSAIMETAEEVLPITLNEHFGTSLNSIYELQEESEIGEFRRKIKAHTVLRDIDRQEEPRYTEVLKWYRLFVKSMHNEDMPLLVPGERQDYDQEAPLSTMAETQETPVEHNDADYAPDSEGLEHQFNLTKKERNPQLRRKCIEYYKKLWGGRIHCICCGFDFGKAYGEIGEDYIEIHHVTPHHTFEGEHMVNPAKDLIPLCSNCHSMIHKGTPGSGTCMTLKELEYNYKGIIYDND